MSPQQPTFNKEKYPVPAAGRGVVVPIELAAEYRRVHGLKVVGSIPGFWPPTLVVVPVDEEGDYDGYVMAERSEDQPGEEYPGGDDAISGEVWPGDDVLDEPD